MSTFHKKTVFLVFVLFVASIAPRASAQCGSSACKSRKAASRQCSQPNREGMCKLARCGESRSWKCQPRGSVSKPILSDHDDYRLIVEYSWTDDQRDLDSSITLFGESEGHMCGGSKYVTSLGDTTEHGGTEKFEVAVGKAAKDMNRSSMYVQFNAVWFNRISFATASLYVYLVDRDDRRITSKSPIFIRPAPGIEQGCASNIVATANIQLSSTPTITLSPRIPNNLYLIANITTPSNEKGFVSATEFAGDMIGAKCEGTSKYIMSTQISKGTKTVHSYVFDIRKARGDGLVGSNSVAMFTAGWAGRESGPTARMNAYLEDGAGRRYPFQYEDEKLYPDGEVAGCPTQEVATAFITFSDSQVRLGLSTS